jgi:hypothetical protein
MRRVSVISTAVVITFVIAFLGLMAPASAAPSRLDEFASTDTVLRWIYGYRAKPDPFGVPAVVRALSRLGTLQDPDQAAVHVGFMAGVIGSNPDIAEVSYEISRGS